MNSVQKQLEDGHLDISELEYGLRKALFSDASKILEAFLNQPKVMDSFTSQGTFHEYRTRKVQGLFGVFELQRGYYKTKSGYYFPLDEKLGLIGKYTPGFSKMICHAAATIGSFKEAEKALSLHTKADIPASQIRAVAQGIGSDIIEWSSIRDESRNREVPTMYVSYDGTGVPMRKEETQGRKGKQPDGSSATRELKLGCVFTSSLFDRDGSPLRDAESTTYVASFNPASEFTPILLNEAKLRGLEKARRKVVLGDGAKWIWNQASMHFPEAVQILDYFHAKEHLRELSRIVRPNEYRSRKLFEKWSKWLDNNRVLDIVKDARKKICCKGHRRNIGEREIKYLETNCKRMMYGTFKEKGYFIGSGVIEAGCKTVVGKRTKQSGMFWQVKGAQNILNIRCAILGNTYDKFWEYRNQTVMARVAS